MPVAYRVGSGAFFKKSIGLLDSTISKKDDNAKKILIILNFPPIQCQINSTYSDPTLFHCAKSTKNIDTMN